MVIPFFVIRYFLTKVDDDLEVGEVPLNEVGFHLFHGNALGLDRLNVRNGLLGLIQTRTRAAAQLFRAKRSYVDVEKTAFDWRRLGVNDWAFVGNGVGADRVHLRDFRV